MNTEQLLANLGMGSSANAASPTVGTGTTSSETAATKQTGNLAATHASATGIAIFLLGLAALIFAHLQK